MHSKFLDSNEVSEASVSQQQLKNSNTKGHAQYNLPENPSQLNDRAARRSETTMMNQFCWSFQSITPPPDATNWAPRNNLIITMDGTTMVDCLSGSRNDRNIVTFVSVVPTTLRVSAGYRGENQSKVISKKIIESGALDDVIAGYQRKCSLRSLAAPNYNVEFASSESDFTATRNLQRCSIFCHPRSINFPNMLTYVMCCHTRSSIYTHGSYSHGFFILCRN